MFFFGKLSNEVSCGLSAFIYFVSVHDVKQSSSWESEAMITFSVTEEGM